MEVFYLSYFTKFECNIEDTCAFMKDYSKFGYFRAIIVNLDIQ